MGELRIWKAAWGLTARGMEALNERTTAERNMMTVEREGVVKVLVGS